MIGSTKAKSDIEVVNSVIRASSIFITSDEADPEEQIEVEIATVGCYGVDLPKRPLSLMYGFRNVLAELAPMMRQATSIGQACHQIDVKVEVTRGQSVHTDIEDLPYIDCLNLARMRQDLKEMVVERWAGFLREERIPHDSDIFRGDRYVIEHPYLIDRLRDDPEFKHLKSIIYPVEYADLRTQRIAIYSRSVIGACTNMNFGNASFSVPAWLKR